MARLEITSLSKQHSRAGLHAEVGPEPSGLTPLSVHRGCFEARRIRIGGGVFQQFAAALIQPKTNIQSVG